jgi:hypothetical protein
MKKVLEALLCETELGHGHFLKQLFQLLVHKLYYSLMLYTLNCWPEDGKKSGLKNVAFLQNAT